MSEIIGSRKELEKFWLELKQDFFNRMEMVINKIGMDRDEYAYALRKLKFLIEKRLERYWQKVDDNYRKESLTYHQVHRYFDSVENLLRGLVNDFIIHWVKEEKLWPEKN